MSGEVQGQGEPNVTGPGVRMPKYRRLSERVEAMQWTPENTYAVFEFIGHPVPVFWDHPSIVGGSALVITTFVGSHLVLPGDWVVKHASGELALVTAEMFGRTYEPDYADD